MNFLFVFKVKRLLVWHKKSNDISLPWSTDICSKRTSFASPIAKPIWTMIVDNAGLQNRHLETSSDMVTLTSFSWCKPKWSRDEFNQWPIECFRGARDDFMVHGVNNSFVTNITSQFYRKDDVQWCISSPFVLFFVFWGTNPSVEVHIFFNILLNYDEIS